MNRKWLLLLVGLVIVFVVDFLIVMVILNSFRTTEDILASHGIAPAQLTLANYSYINTRTSLDLPVQQCRRGVTSSALSIALAGLAGFAMSRFRAKDSRAI